MKLDFKKMNGLIPTIIQDEKGQVLTLAYSTRESLAKTMEIGKGCYFSRARGRVAMKGETSGNVQEVIDIRYDCDKDALLFIVTQKNVACCTGSYSCFGDQKYSLGMLYGIMIDRLNNSKGSYTSKILESEKKIMAKIAEESQEVLNYTDRDNLIWEIADLTYFVLMLMVKKGISLEEIKNELQRRRK